MKFFRNALMTIFHAAILIHLSGTAALSGSYYLVDSTTYYDADKSSDNSDDDLMCWAASVSNLLAWTGWGSVYSSNEDKLFSYFQEYWTDAGSTIYNGLYWWFTGENLYTYRGWAQEEVDGGGGFYPAYRVTDYLAGTDNPSSAMDAIASLLQNGYAIGLSLYNGGSSGHAVTLWGYETDSENNFSGIWITDSDDGLIDTLVYYDVICSDGKWYLQNFYGYYTYYIYQVLGLESIPSTIASSAVPAPGTMLLFASGLACLSLVRRRDRQFSIFR